MMLKMKADAIKSDENLPDLLVSRLWLLFDCITHIWWISHLSKMKHTVEKKPAVNTVSTETNQSILH